MLKKRQLLLLISMPDPDLVLTLRSQVGGSLESGREGCEPPFVPSHSLDTRSSPLAAPRRSSNPGWDGHLPTAARLRPGCALRLAGPGAEPSHSPESKCWEPPRAPLYPPPLAGRASPLGALKTRAGAQVAAALSKIQRRCG